MPLQKIQLRPGLNREGTSLSNEGGWFDGDKIRFRSGYPEKLGGWTAITFTAFLGVCRSLWNWITLKQFNLLGIGTNLKFYIENGGTYYDITPIRETNGFGFTGAVTFSAVTVNPFSSTITVTDTSANNLQVGDFVTFGGAIALSTQTYTVNTTTDVLTFTTALTDNTTIQLFTTSSTPAGLSIGTTYYVVNASGATCKLSLTLGGTAINITSVGSGTQTFALTTGITAAVLNQEYQIASILSGTTYTVQARSAVAGDVSTINGGTPVLSNALDTGNGAASPTTLTTAAYQISTGYATYTIGTGWGAGPWAGTVTSTLINPFTTTNGSGIVTVAHSGHTLTVGQEVVFQSSAYPTATIPAVGGLPAGCLQANFIVKSVSAGVSYTIWTNGNTASTLATSSATGGGTVIVYPQSTTLPLRGWGTGFTTGFDLQLRLWSQANFGEDLLFNPRGSQLYIWQPLNAAFPAYGNRGVAVTGTDVPASVNQIMVSDTSRITIAFGCNDYGVYDTNAPINPLLIRWTATESYTGWTPSATNQARSYQLSHGSTIVCAIQTRQEIIVWTDTAIYSMQYIGYPNVYGFTLLADNISIISPSAAATASGIVYWMGVDKFYVYSGRVETLPCSVRTFVFNDINRDQFEQCFSGTNEGFSEVWWFYCSANSDAIDRYVIFNYLDRVWYYGTLGRTAWLDSPLREFPQATTTENLLVFHEVGTNDGTTNPPSPIYSYVQSSDVDIGDGHNYGFIWRMLPDITFDGSTTASPAVPQVNFTMRPKQNPGAPYSPAPSPTVQAAQSYNSVKTYNVQEFTQIIYTRVRGREMAFRIESNTLGTQWQLGVPRMDVRSDGRR